MGDSTISEDDKLKIAKYEKWVSYNERYITKNIMKIIDDKSEFDFLLQYPRLLSLTNYSKINALEILIANKRIDVIEKVIDSNIDNIYLADNEEPLFHAMLKMPETYDLIIQTIPKITNHDIFFQYYGTIPEFQVSFFEKCMSLLWRWLNNKYDDVANKLLKIVILSLEHWFKNITNLTLQYYIVRQITLVCSWLVNLPEKLNYFISTIKMPKIILRQDASGMTIVDYLLKFGSHATLNTFLDVAEHITFKAYENTLFETIELQSKNVELNKKEFIALILKLISKSNVQDIFDYEGNNIIMILLKHFTLETNLDIKVMSIALMNFDIFEQNIYGESVFTIATNKLKEKSKQLFPLKYYADSQIKIDNPYDINITKIYSNFSPKNILTKTNVGDDTTILTNHQLFFLEICKKYADVMQPMYSKKIPRAKILQNKGSNNNVMYLYKNNKNLLMNCIFYRPEYFMYFPPDIENTILKSNKRFMCFYVAIVHGDGGGHANILIVDNTKKTIERYEPAGDLSQAFLLDEILKYDIADKIGYTYNRSIGSGLQARDLGDHVFNYTFGDTKGYCVAWCMCVLELRMSYPDFELQKIVKLINNYIINQFADDFNIENKPMENYIKFIRYYSQNLEDRVIMLDVFDENNTIDKKKYKKEFEKLL